MTRRNFVALGAVVVVTGAAGASQWFNIRAGAGGDVFSVPQAHQAALAGQIVLVDIRRPDEWALTGVGEGALPIDMQRADFTAALHRAVEGDRARPVALICARGLRSRRLAATLRAAGFDRIIDVPEGMLGSGAGPGWIERGLPLRMES